MSFAAAAEAADKSLQLKAQAASAGENRQAQTCKVYFAGVFLDFWNVCSVVDVRPVVLLVYKACCQNALECSLQIDKSSTEVGRLREKDAMTGLELESLQPFRVINAFRDGR